MGQTRNRDSVKVNEEGKKRLIKAKASKTNHEGKLWTYLDISRASNVSEATVKRFFARKDVDRPYAEAIAKALDLNLDDLIDTTPPEDTPPVSPEHKPDTSINWPDICREMLEKQATSNSLLHQDEDTKKEREQIYVPLALVQRKKVEKREKVDFAPDAGTQLYEPNYEQEQKFEHQAFLSQILEQGEGKTKGRQVALIGEPGAGKTTLLQTIAFWILDQNLGLPIWISLADLGRNGNKINLQQYICEIWLKQAVAATEFTPEKQADFQQQMEQGRVWLLLDGADEMSVGTQFHQPLETIAQQLKGWIEQKTRVVLTCRLNVWQADVNALSDFETYRLLDFDYPSQVRQFINNWFDNEKGREKGERLKTELAKSEKARLQDLIQNPMRLTLLCSIWQREEGNLPETKAGLYQQFVDYIYNWKINQFTTTKKQQRELNTGLSQLARRDIDAGGSRFRLREDFIIKELGYPDEENALFYLALKLGWLNHIGIAAESPSQKVYAFYHATFEEYFAALAVDDWTYFFHHDAANPSQGTYRIFQPQWKEVILLWLGREDVEEEQKEAFIQALCSFQDGCGKFYQYRAFFLAAAGIGEFKECKLSDEVIKKLIRYDFGYFDQDKQKWLKFTDALADTARKVIPETNYQKAIQALVELIRNSDYDHTNRYDDTKRRVAKCLGKIGNGNKYAMQAMVDLIRNSDDTSTKITAAYSLVEIGNGNEYAIQALVELIRNFDDESTKYWAAYSLIKIDNANEKATQALVDLIRNSNDKYIKVRASESLVEIGNSNKKAIQAMVDLIRNSDDESIKYRAADSLGEIGNGNEYAIQALADLIRNSDNEYTKYSAVKSLVKIGDGNEKAIQALVELIHSSDDEDTKIMAVKSLGEIGNGNEYAIQALADLIRNSDDEGLKITAAESLGEIGNGNEYAIQALVDLIRNSDHKSTKYRAAYSLVKIGNGDEYAIQALVDLICNSDDEDTKRMAAYSLIQIGNGNEYAIQTLVDLICNSDDEDTKRMAVDSLGEIGNVNEKAIQALVDLIRNSDHKSTKYKAAYSLVRIGEYAIQTLVNLIRNSDDEYTKYRAADSLGEIVNGNEYAIQALVDLIRNSDHESTKRMAAYSLVRIGEYAIQALVDLIRNSDHESIKYRAADSLGEIGGNEYAIQALVDLIRNSDHESIKYRAADSLGEIGNGNKYAIQALADLIRNSDHESTKRRAVESLVKIGGNEYAIQALADLIRNSDHESTKITAAYSLVKIGNGNEKAIQALADLIRNSDHESTKITAADSLVKIGGNEYAIHALVDLIRNSDNKYTKITAAYSLEEIGNGNEKAIHALADLISNSDHEYTYIGLADSLVKTGNGNEYAIHALVDLIRNSDNEYTKRTAAYSLNKITDLEQMTMVITNSQKYLPKDVYERSFMSFDRQIYQLFWNFAQSLSYPEFYAAWQQVIEN